MCTTVGLAVMGEMMTAEMTAKEMTAKVGGPKHAKLAQRQGNLAWERARVGRVGPRRAGRAVTGPHRCGRRDRARRLRRVQ
jgi:hypothetical protein